MNRLRCTSILILSVMAAACALSPQTVHIQPDIDLSKANPIGQNTPVTLQVVDNRPSRVVGSRGGVYADTALITTAEGIGPAIHSDLVHGLRILGYEVVGADKPASGDLKVLVDAIEYKVTGERVTKHVETSATVRAVARVGSREFTGRYRGMQAREVLRNPSTELNDELINAAVARVLERMLTDRELLEFLRDG